MSTLIEEVAKGQAEFDGRPWMSMPREQRDRYCERADIAIKATLSYLRDNENETLSSQFRLACYDYATGKIIAFDGLSKIFDTALQEIEER